MFAGFSLYKPNSHLRSFASTAFAYLDAAGQGFSDSQVFYFSPIH